MKVLFHAITAAWFVTALVAVVAVGVLATRSAAKSPSPTVSGPTYLVKAPREPRPDDPF